MVHEILINQDGSASFASVETSADKKAWHGLGQTIVREAGKYATKQEIMEASKTNFLVEKVPAFMQVGDEFVYVEGKSVIRRSDTKQAFGIMGDTYETIQNEDVAEFAEIVIGESGAFFDTGGALMGGSKVFYSLMLPDAMMAGENIGKRMIVSSSHDGTGSVLNLLSLVRPVCWNTLSCAIKGSSDKVAIRHTKNWKNKVEEVRRVLKIAANHFTEIEKAFESLRSEKVNDSYVQGFINTLFPASSKVEGKIPLQTLDKREKVKELFLRGKGNSGETKWDLFNGVTELLDHHSNGRVTSRALYRSDVDANIEEEQKFLRVNFGQGARIRQEAFDLLMAN